MEPTFDTSGIISILKEALAEMITHSDEMRKLDAVLGDGDMGVTIELGCRAVTEYLDSATEDDIGKLLTKCGFQFNKASPSTFGTLLSAAFIEAGKACLGRKEIGIEALSLIGQSAVDGIKKRGKSEIGEKTMLDSLVPAVDAFKNALESGDDPKLAVDLAIKAAEKGMKATTGMKAKHSRASWRPEGGFGVQDAGATAMYYLIEALGRKWLVKA